MRVSKNGSSGILVAPTSWVPRQRGACQGSATRSRRAWPLQASTAPTLEVFGEQGLKSLLPLPRGEREEGLGGGTPSHSFFH